MLNCYNNICSNDRLIRLKKSSRSLLTDYVLYFVISPRLILQMCAGISDVTLYFKILHHLSLFDAGELSLKQYLLDLAS